ncbi:hypothetical protein [Allonocardiopsis opalescens]|uniref:Uncharacterized protein n=1 Tax=Allonocardiopsis opalescens TaxID=1144618 RepID=A0A2T0Q9B2_9ACTN|nr:hypothetical protein [Allonocardiopsis opalescens]PRY00402.1 hypothetical protein CLV72_10231 [Allonocardiopsis opalescens]
MTEVRLADPVRHEVDLVVEPRLHGWAPAEPDDADWMGEEQERTRYQDLPPAEERVDEPPQVRLPGRLSVGGPVVRRLTAQEAAGETDWAAFLAEEAERSEYFLLHLVLSFRPDRRSPPGGEPFADAAVGVLLHSPDAGPGEQPVAWSITPKSRSGPRTGEPARVVLNAKLVFVESTLEFSPGGGGAALTVVGMGERQSDPEWRFTARPEHPLVGDEHVAVVVKAPRGRALRASVQVSASVRRRRLGLVPVRAELPGLVRSADLRALAAGPVG